MLGLEQLPWYAYASIALLIIAAIVYLRKRNYISPDDLVEVKQVIALVLPLVQDEGVRAALTVVLEYLRYVTKETTQYRADLKALAAKAPANIRGKLLLLAERVK
jgi:hypothetical protein